MTRLDHVAFESDDPAAAAEFLDRALGAGVVAAEGHPVMAYVGTGGFAFHQRGGPGFHAAVRVDAEERAAIAKRLDDLGIAWEERDHGVGVGLFFTDPEGRRFEAITYRAGDDPRR